jgi:hypothetical protein
MSNNPDADPEIETEAEKILSKVMEDLKKKSLQLKKKKGSAGDVAIVEHLKLVVKTEVKLRLFRLNLEKSKKSKQRI